MNIPKLPRPINRMLPGMFFIVAAAATSLSAQRIVTTESNTAPIIVESATISAEITGRFAVTSFDLVFRNPNNRILEGTFEFPLLAGQSIVGLSLDINGRQREAVPVEKDRGRVVFEEIVRRLVDPALLEKTAGNNYRLRIFPIPAKGTRRVVITYQEDLAGGPGNPVYRLALNFPSPLEVFKLAVNVQSDGSSSANARTTLPLTLPEWREAKYLDLQETRFAATGIVEIELPYSIRAKVLTERRGEHEYFYAELPVNVSSPVVRPAPQVVGLLWDASGSGRNRDHDRELALLDAWFGEVKNVEVKLQVFRDQAAAPLLYQVKNGDWSKLRIELTKMIYDGATSFDGLTDDPAVGEWLMFSDGLANYGVNQTAASLSLRAPVHAILAGSQADPALLRGLAERQSGEFVNLLTTKPATAAHLLRLETMRVLAIDHDPEQIAQIFPEPNSPVNEGSLIVTGILKVPTASLRLRIGHNASDAKEIELPIRSGANPSRLAARAWASTKISALETDPAANREEIRRTSQEFGIVTANTSLIVLETLQDYLRYDIMPPAELRADWEANRRTSIANLQKGKSDKLDEITQLFAEKVKWWETEFPAEPPPAPQNPMITAVHTATTTQPVARIESAISSVLVPSRPAVHSELPESLEEEVVVLTPFVVEAPEDRGYRANQTLAGTRLRTELRDIGANIAVNTRQFLQDTASASNQDLLEYTANAESAGGGGNFVAGADAAGAFASIALRPWEAKAGYLDRLRKASPDQRYSIYLEERSDHARQPGFFLDVAEFFFEAKDTGLALRILSNLAELQLDDSALFRVLANRLVQANRPELALSLFERVLVLRPEEPQSRRDLALVCAALKQNQRAVDLLWAVVVQSWDARFQEIELMALGELNAIIATCGENLDLSHIDARLLRNLPVGLRAVLTWDTDNSDVDLWVDDPNGEQAIYSHPRTAQGGRMSCDFTAGYGPEEFLLRDPKPGKYTVRINYYVDSRQTAFGPVTAQIRLITGFGTPKQREQLLTVRLSEEKENLEVGQITIGE